MSIGLSSRVQRQSSVVFTQVESELVTLSLEKSKYFILNDVGRRIWELLEKPLTVEEICGRLLEVFEVDQETCQNEVLSFVGSMAEAGLVEVKDS